MMNRRALQALAEAMADVGTEQGMDEEETVAAAAFVINRIRSSDPRAVTANFSQDRFDAAVRAAFRGE